MCIYYHIVIIASCLKDSSPPFIRCSKPTSANHSPGSHAIAMMTTKTVQWLQNARSCAICGRVTHTNPTMQPKNGVLMGMHMRKKHAPKIN